MFKYYKQNLQPEENIRKFLSDENIPRYIPSSAILNFTSMTEVANDQNPTFVPHRAYSTQCAAYDNDTNTYAGSVFPGDAGTQTGFIAKTTFIQPIPVVSSLRVLAYIQNGTNFYINGTHLGPTFTEFFTTKWVNVTAYAGGSFQSIQWGYNSGYWNAYYFLPFVIEVDGRYLVDNMTKFY